MNTLTERYVTEAVAHVPQDQRDEVEREIRSAVNDIVESRIASGQDPQSAETAALEELGDPQAFARQFGVREPSLIGPRWYPVWKEFALRVVPAAGLVTGTIVAAVSLFGGDQGAVDDLTNALLDGLSTGVEVALQVLIGMTIVFAIIERTTGPDEAPATKPWSIADLPSATNRPQITLGTTVSDLVALISIGAVAWILTRTGVFRELEPGTTNDGMPLLNPDLPNHWVMLFLALLALSVAMIITRHMIGYWTSGALATAIVENLAWVLGIGAMAAYAQLINPDVPEAFGELEGDWWASGEAANWVILAVTVIVAAFEIYGAIKAHREYAQQSGQHA